MAQDLNAWWLFASLLVFACLLVQVRGYGNGFPAPDPQLLAEFPLLGSVTAPLVKSPWLGGQNFTHCCLQAISESYVSSNGILVNNPNAGEDFVGLTPNALSLEQFPCGATYDNNLAGAPPVTIPYSWCAQNCAGWQQSTNNPLTQWVQPFVGFILPAAVFCLNVPRKSALGVPDGLFKDTFKDVLKSWHELTTISISLWDHTMPLGQDEAGDPVRAKDFVSALVKVGFELTVMMVFTVLRGSMAAGVSLVDTVIWVGICFSTAGPMILSGLYEATLDRKIIDSISKELELRKTSGDEKQAGKTRKHEDGKNVEEKNKTAKNECDGPEKSDSNEDMTHKEDRAFDGTPGFSLQLHLLYAVLVGNLIQDAHRPGTRSAWEDVLTLLENGKERKTTRTRLTGMLNCQASFGAAICAPIVFFLGSFMVGVISNLTLTGDNDSSHALAFGMWWMTIPHTAVVSGCLLAGNNPNTLEVIMCNVIRPWTDNKPPDDELNKENIFWLIRLFNWIISFYGPSYKSVYGPVWMWERGRSKREWVRKVLKNNYICAAIPEQGVKPSDLDVEAQSTHTRLPAKDKAVNKFRLSFLEWVDLILSAAGLMIIPLVLAFLTSYYTPTVGLSCRTFTFFLYFCFQVWLSAIWFWDFQHEKRWPLTTPQAWVPIFHRRPTVFCLLGGFGMLGSLFTTVVGTFLQLLGVFRNCLCSIPMSAWASRHSSFVISSNTQQDIYYANHLWIPTGVASICVMIVVCYVGWWYQRHWQFNFNSLLGQLLPEPESGSELESKKGKELPDNGEVGREKTGNREVTGDVISFVPLPNME